MNKYYKAEDIIRKRAEDLADTSYWEWGNPKNVDEWIEVAEMEFKDLPTIEVSEDCISRDWVLNRLTKYQKDYTFNELDDWQNTVVEWITTDIEDAPSVAPTTEQSSMVGEWIERIGGISKELFYQCGKCYGEVDTNEFDYCPWCGAKMKGAEE